MLYEVDEIHFTKEQINKLLHLHSTSPSQKQTWGMAYGCGMGFRLRSKSGPPQLHQTSCRRSQLESMDLDSPPGESKSAESLYSRVARRLQRNTSSMPPLDSYLPSQNDTMSCGCGMAFRLRSAANVTKSPFDSDHPSIKDLNSAGSPTSARSLLNRAQQDRFRRSLTPSPSTSIQFRKSL